VTDDEEQAAPQWFLSYKSGVGRVCKGDGYQAQALLDMDVIARREGDVTQPLPVEAWASSASKKTQLINIECPGKGYDGAASCPAYAAKKCKGVMMPQFAIPAAPGLGVYQIDTSSEIGMGNINGFVSYLKSITGGRISGIPLTLKLVPAEVSPDGKKKTVHVLQLDAAFSLTELVEHLKSPALTALLPAPDEEVPADLFPAEASAESELEQPEMPGEYTDSREAAEREALSSEVLSYLAQVFTRDQAAMLSYIGSHAPVAVNLDKGKLIRAEYDKLGLDVLLTMRDELRERISVRDSK
jgi:hypothetical protein